MLGFDAGWSGFDVGSWLSVFCTSVCMLSIQYLLLKTDRARKVLPPEVVPTQTELYAAVGCFWLSYLGSIKTLLHGIRGLLWILSELNFLDRPQFPHGTSWPSRSEDSPKQEFSEAKLGLQLFNLVILTWQLHQVTLLIINVTIPFIKKVQQHPQFALSLLCSRLQSLIAFLQLITIGQSSTSQQIPLKLCISDENSSLSTIQKVRLQRTQTASPKKGRTLSWSLTVDKEALDEMKETLGPPGGFGELGFCVGKDEVRFEAMGKGTSFGLMFGIEDKEDGVVTKPAVRPVVSGRRRKTK
ncbi:uncharacterized protein LY89DRAFT_275530 [Mollisia scopiformis]|uniref:Uncharacterized protein n=1 Tax=Mollisia scopiformis TaxID=149040 RepID=A0A132BCU9_MOLSC|nr:uncharacterized protein LY89DRAFT_275530 [Mollisia scopiformis]KUJ09674.1 hypothetical protein LY89DRAFT_275530 [Mollisia scopiformis]